MSTSQYFPVQAIKFLRYIITILFMMTVGTCARAQQRNIAPIEIEGFVFQFKGCRSTTNSDVPLTCDFLVKNSQETRRTLKLYEGRVVDVNGEVITGSFVKLGDDVDTNRSVRQELPTGIPIKGSVSFPQAPEGNIVLFDLRLYASKSFDVEFYLNK